ncbi:hypothetical protein BC940DRAFT_352118 [Gongronella butleri]|nr:hypothetical protein BC940DRAFT_352118 [Gongronella butleri]
MHACIWTLLIECYVLFTSLGTCLVLPMKQRSEAGSLSARATGSALVAPTPGILAVDTDAGRACIVGLNDCPDGTICIEEDDGYGHCGPNPKFMRRKFKDMVYSPSE